VFWTNPDSRRVVVQRDLLSRSASVMVYSYQDRGVNGDDWFSAPAPVAGGLEGFCPGEPDGADASGLFDPAEQAIQLDAPPARGSAGLDQGFTRKPNQQDRFRC